ncbi:MAG TPA: TylF/MycF/NovP-related O-methyltransferase [Ktedonobacteraceae bacterium]|nr:TylF/MycF/NovP-related O-methyltransferase [Ktedonobacteraceae bacterium]
MHPNDYIKLMEDVEQELLLGRRSIGILGVTTVTLQILRSLAPTGLLEAIRAIYVNKGNKDVVEYPKLSVPIHHVEELANVSLDILIVAADTEKELLIREALPFIQGTPKIIVAGYGHLEFSDPIFREEFGQLLVPSSADGYPHTLTHIYQCLKNAARLELQGVVAEFGMFKGGTTMLISRLIERLGMKWPVIGFDTFNGFPPRRSPLDMYDHPGCFFYDLPAVRRYFDGRNVEIVPGDIVETCNRLANQDLVLTFIDTDNYTPAKAAIEFVRERTLVGGAIVFDHFTGVNRFRYTLGERIAGSVLLDDIRYFHLHNTGVFYRQI